MAFINRWLAGEREQSHFLRLLTTTFPSAAKQFQHPCTVYTHGLNHRRSSLFIPESQREAFCSCLNSRDGGTDLWGSLVLAVLSKCVGEEGWFLCKLNRPSFFFLFFPHSFHSQEALAVFKEAVQKMPRQFAPQSLYNMMGKSYSIKGRLCLGNKGLFAASQLALCSLSVEAAAVR